MEWQYSIDGDGFEQRHCEIFSALFPNHETFWSKFVIPTTNRSHPNPTVSNGPRRMASRSDASNDLLSLGQLNYSIFSHLIDARKSIEQTNIENFYYHTGTVIDLAGELLWKITKKIKPELAETTLLKLTEAAFQKVKDEYSYASYEKKHAKWLLDDTYPGPSLPIHDKPTQVGWHKVVSDDLRVSFIGLSGEIRNYRNLIAHRPIFLRIEDENGNIGLPNQKSVKKYLDWTVEATSEKFLNENISDFVSAPHLMSSQWKNIVTTLNLIWQEIIILLEEDLQSDPLFQKLAWEAQVALIKKTGAPSSSSSSPGNGQPEGPQVTASGISRPHIVKIDDPKPGAD